VKDILLHIHLKGRFYCNSLSCTVASCSTNNSCVLYRHVAFVDSPGATLVKKLLLQVVEDVSNFEPSKKHLGSEPPAHNLQEAHQFQAQCGDPTCTTRNCCSRGVHHMRLCYR
jgi:hypothetical protein